MVNASISIVMNGIKKCSGSCMYCSASSTMHYRAEDNKTTFVFYPKKLKKTILEFCKEQLGRGQKEGGVELAIDIWGGNPVENFDPFKKVVDFCENELKEFKSVRLHTSGNGLELRDNDIVEYLIKHNVHYQLSHDGLGQWLRTGVCDPLYWDKTKDNIVRLAKMGILDWINCTLSARNPSFFDNIEYWNKWRKENGLYEIRTLTIKLNHIYDGTKPIDRVWNLPDNPQIKKGEVIGDLCFHGEVMHEYLHEFRKLALICHTPGVENNPVWQPYIGYIKGQANRFRMIKSSSEAGMCVAYQRGEIDHNFAIDTKGKYCECNLIDSDNHVHNPIAKQPDYCKNCKYKNLAECNKCGSENYSEKCEYNWWWAKTLEETYQMLELIRVFNGLNKKNQACNCQHPSNNNNDPVYCVRNYKL